MATGTWYFIVAWYDSTSGTLNIQVNNGAVDSGKGTVLNGTADFAIGARRDSLPLYFDGRIDEVGMWKRLLSTSERSSLYNSAAGCAYPFSSCPSTVGAPATGQTWRSYYYAGARRIAERVLTATGGNTLYDLHSDPLGSTSLVTCASTGAASACSTLGQVVDRENYYPYGSARSGGASIPTDFRFTGQRQQASLGIYDFGARFYDPVVGRFLSPDSIVPGAGNPQALNRYSYTNGNPLHYIDPSGHDPIDALAYLAGILYGWGHANLVALGPIVPQPAMAQYDELAVNNSDAFTEGRVTGGLATIAQGTGEGGTGITAVGGGGLLCGTGVGCLLGGGEAVVAGAGLVVHGTSAAVAGAAEAGQQSNILFAAKTPSQIQKSIRTIQGNIDEHEAKLARYINDPDAEDNKGLLKGAPAWLREKIMAARIDHLQSEINNWYTEIEKLQNQLDSDAGSK